ncbi:MAG: glycoside hydrolase family 5 protein [Bacteroidota bacterium]
MVRKNFYQKSTSGFNCAISLRLVLTLLCTAFLMSSCGSSDQSKLNEDNQFTIRKGTNIAHFLSQSKRQGEERKQFFTEKDVKAIAAMGFDHIRLPIDEEQMWDDNGNRHQEAFQLMTNAIDWSIANDLKVVVDLHILRSHYFNAEIKPLWIDPAEQEKFFDLWRDLSKTLSKYPNNRVAYELMNEAVADDPESWNSLLNKAFAAIRALEPKRTIVIGSNSWQSVNTFDVLKVPANDPHILLSFHFYEPFLLTHYQARWTYLKNYSGPVKYPGVILTEEEFSQLPDSTRAIVDEWVGREFDKSIIEAMWQKPLAKAKELGLPLYCGEFGILTTAAETDRLNWYRDMIGLLEKKGIAYANWNYNSDEFGLTDNGKRNEELIKIVSGTE